MHIIARGYKLFLIITIKWARTILYPKEGWLLVSFEHFTASKLPKTRLVFSASGTRRCSGIITWWSSETLDLARLSDRIATSVWFWLVKELLARELWLDFGLHSMLGCWAAIICHTKEVKNPNKLDYHNIISHMVINLTRQSSSIMYL